MFLDPLVKFSIGILCLFLFALLMGTYNEWKMYKKICSTPQKVLNALGKAGYEITEVKSRTWFSQWNISETSSDYLLMGKTVSGHEFYDLMTKALYEDKKDGSIKAHKGYLDHFVSKDYHGKFAGW
ncbi:hypothetical protein ASwh1_95 [Aeromonas phage Aswh_1]|nr:hypothetical protein ASwh1_95 [Aeromonas phage Aswh_1]